MLWGPPADMSSPYTPSINTQTTSPGLPAEHQVPVAISWSALLLLLAMPAMSTLCVTAVQIYLAQGMRPLTTLMVAALTLFIYALNGYSDQAEDAVNDPARAATLRRSSAWTLGISSTALLIAAVLLAERGRLHPVYAAIAFAGVAYSFRVIPWLGQGKLVWLRLKDIALIKNLTIAVTWGAAVFMVPILDLDAQLRTSGNLTFVVVTYLLLVGQNSVFCDLRDEAGDREAGARTLPVVFGPGRCFVAVFALALVWSVVLIVALVNALLDGPTSALLLLVSLGYPAAVWWGYTRRAMNRNLERALIESSDVCFAAGLILLGLLGFTP